MSEQITNTTTLGSLAEKANASGDWWKEGALERRNVLELPTRTLVALGNAGIHTVEQLRTAGPTRLHNIDGLGKLAFQQIVDLLRELDRRSNGGGA
jgi:DNA-directed RNA polymerase alpha subunit